MRLILLLCLFSIFISSNVIAQNVQFKLDGKVKYIRADSTQYQTEASGFSNVFINDSTYLRRSIEYRTTRQKKYTPKIAYELNGQFIFSLSNRFSLSTGLGFNYMSFDIASDIVASEFVFTSEDTIRSSIEESTFFSSCDVYENSIQDLGELKQGIQQDILNLMIPMKLHYHLVPNLINVQLGAYLQTPIYSLQQRERIQFHREMINNQNVCSYEKISEKDTAGNGLRNMQVLCSIDIEYLINAQLSFEIGLRKNFSNTFVDIEFQQTPYDHEVFKSLALNAGMAYTFSKKEKD